MTETFSPAGGPGGSPGIPPPGPPPGTPHGATAVRVAGGLVVLISEAGTSWGLPGGRPEPAELVPLHRRMLDEAGVS